MSMWQGHPDLDEFVVPLEELERLAGLRLFPELEQRKEELAPLCGGGGGASRCGLGAPLDGLIRGNKALGGLKLASSCEELEEAWAHLSSERGSSAFHRRTYDQRARTLTCSLASRA